MGKYFDDFEVGERYQTMGRTITETELVKWLMLSGFSQESFSNRERAKQTIFQRPIIPAPMTLAFATGLFAQFGVMQGTAIAYLSGQIKAIAPLFVGDTIYDEVEVSAKKSTSKPDRGVVTLLHTVTNQQKQPVLSFNQTFLVQRRDAAEPEEG